jgi:hypothetical protein
MSTLVRTFFLKSSRATCHQYGMLPDRGKRHAIGSVAIQQFADALMPHLRSSHSLRQLLVAGSIPVSRSIVSIAYRDHIVTR